MLNLLVIIPQLCSGPEFKLSGPVVENMIIWIEFYWKKHLSHMKRTFPLNLIIALPTRAQQVRGSDDTELHTIDMHNHRTPATGDCRPKAAAPFIYSYPCRQEFTPRSPSL